MPTGESGLADVADPIEVRRDVRFVDDGVVITAAVDAARRQRVPLASPVA